MERLRKLFLTYFMSAELPFDARMLNTTCLLGAIASVAALISRLIAGLPLIAIAPLLVMVAVVAAILFLSLKTAKHAALLTTVIICCVSIVFWPMLYFTVGGHGSGMAAYFALAIILDFMLLKGAARVCALVSTLIVTILCFASTIFWGLGALPAGGLSPYQLFIDYMQSILVVGFLVGVIALYQNRSYRIEKNKADEARTTTSAMFGANPQINILIDSNFKIIDCNPAAVVLFGYPAKEDFLEGFFERTTNSIPAFQPDGRPSIPLSQRLMTAATEGSARFETELHLSPENIRNLDVEFKRIPYGNSFAIVGYVFDMTEIHKREMELKQRDLQLREAVAEARAANHAKSNFLATMSHEIRTPMNAILGIAEIQLQSESLDKGVYEAFSRISASGEMLLGIINDILDLSKIEAGKLELMIDHYEIASLLSDTAQLNMMRIGSKSIDFELDADENIPSVLSGDALRIKQILNNILSNAFKYTTKGTVSLSVYAEPCISGDISEDTVVIVFRISDTGQGMTAGQVEMLFDRYARFNMEANRATEGAGLGMSITQNLIHLMHGEMFIESEPYKGSVFTVRIPQMAYSPATLGKEMAENLRNFRSSSAAQMRRVQINREPMPYGSVLIVDDVETNIYVAKGLLAPYKLKIDAADSGFAAIEKIKSGKVYDVVFMDHMMPKMDGIEATRIIRSIGYDRPVVALTANAVSGQADIFLKNGFDGFISKPIDIRQMNAVLQKLIRDKQPAEVIEAAKKACEEKKAAGSEITWEEEKPGLARNSALPPIDIRFAEAFTRDATRVLATLEAISAENDYSLEDTMRTYIINMHGIKSALANVGKMDLSAIALKLEAAGRGGMLDLVTNETSSFIESLKEFVEDLTLQGQGNADGAHKEYLHKILLEVKLACDQYDESAADAAISELRKKKWAPDIGELLRKVSGLLLHSDFDEASDMIGKFLA